MQNKTLLTTAILVAIVVAAVTFLGVELDTIDAAIDLVNGG